MGIAWRYEGYEFQVVCRIDDKQWPKRLLEWLPSKRNTKERPQKHGKMMYMKQ